MRERDRECCGYSDRMSCERESAVGTVTVRMSCERERECCGYSDSQDVM